MTTLLRFDAVSFSFGDQRVLIDADFVIDDGEKICLIGRNGAGKSTTLNLIKGTLEPDEGSVERTSNLRVSVLNQKLADGSSDTVRAVVARGLAAQSHLIKHYETCATSHPKGRAALAELEELERRIEAGGGWSVDTQVDRIMTQLQLPGDMRMEQLSGGWRRRVALAEALVSNPDLLLLDEPTNHLDITTIEWLETRIRDFPGAVLFVTHDRTFMEGIATRIVDIDRGALRSWPGAWRDYLRRKAEAEAAEDRQNQLFDRKLAEEETWIRQGVKARERRNEGRVRALESMREERAERIARPRTPKVHIQQTGELSGRKVIEAKNISHGYDGRLLLDDFSLRVMRGERIGIIGNNGVGKSTLLQILLGALTPDQGSVKTGTHLQVAYFDQLRRELDDSKTVTEIVGEGRDYISINGRQKHVVGYLTDFLFSAKRAMTRVSALSGGERNRVILAKLFTQAANLLVLDEPTNDLDVETLEALERRLVEYDGTLIVVSHDRYFLDAVVTCVLVFEADGVVRRYAGGYSDWASRHHDLAVQQDETPSPPNDSPTASRRDNRPPRKLSYKLQRELDQLPAMIENLEGQVAALRTTVSQPEFFQQEHTTVEAELEQLATLEQELDRAIDRWAELESQAENLATRED